MEDSGSMMRFVAGVAGAAMLFWPSLSLAQVVYPNPNQFQGVTIDQYNPRLVPAVQTPTNKLKNSIGRAVEKACLRSGRLAPACAAAAAAAGGVGIARLYDASWEDIGQFAADAATGAAVGAGANCLAGGTIGFFTAGPAGAVAGCTGGLLYGALSGGFFGAATSDVFLTKDQSVKIAASSPDGGLLAGSGVTQVSSSSQSPVALHQAVYGSCSSSSCLRNFNGPVQVDSTFPIQDNYVTSGSNYRRALKFSIQRNSSSNQWTFAGSTYTSSSLPQCVNPQTGGISFGSPIICQAGLFSVVRVENSFAYCQAGESCSTGLTGILTFYAVDFAQSWANSSDVPVVRFVPVEGTPAWAGAFGPALNPGSLSKDVSDQVIAGLANAAWAAAGSSAGDGAYNSSQPVLSGDVASAVAANPEDQVQVQDLYRPIASPTAAGGTAANPISEPQPVVNVTPGSSTGSQSQTGTSADNPTYTQEATKNDLEAENAGLLGNPLQPVLDFIAGPFAIYTNPIITGPGAQPCPVWEIEYMSYFSPLRTDHGEDQAINDLISSVSAVSTAPVCDWLEQWKSVVQAVIGFGLVFLAFVWYFE